MVSSDKSPHCSFISLLKSAACRGTRKFCTGVEELYERGRGLSPRASGYGTRKMRVALAVLTMAAAAPCTLVGSLRFQGSSLLYSSSFQHRSQALGRCCMSYVLSFPPSRICRRASSNHLNVRKFHAGRGDVMLSERRSRLRTGRMMSASPLENSPDKEIYDRLVESLRVNQDEITKIAEYEQGTQNWLEVAPPLLLPPPSSLPLPFPRLLYVSLLSANALPAGLTGKEEQTDCLQLWGSCGAQPVQVAAGAGRQHAL
eukprot:751156-Hanusia_phi.AAC.3